MAKVSNRNTYPQDVNLSMLDYLLGTNSNTGNKKTQTYELQSIFSLFYNFLGYNAFLNTTDTTTYPIGTPGCFYVFDENDALTTDFSEARKITFSSYDTYNFDTANYFNIIVSSGKFLFKLINLEDKNNFVFLSPSNFVLSGPGTTFNVDVLAEAGLSNGSFVNYKRYLLVLEFAAGTFDPADYDLTDFTNTSGNPFVRQDALDLKLNISDYNDRFKGKYTSFFSLITTIPTANTGDYAIVDSGSGSDAIEYIYDEEEGWVQGNSVGSSTTDGLVEGSSNLYFTTARVLATVLSGLSLATGGTIVSTDSILVAFGKIQKQIDDLTTSIGDKLDKVTTVDVEKVYIKNADGTQGMKATSDFGGNVSTDNFNSLILGTDSQLYKEVEFGTAQRNTGVCESMGYSYNTLAISQLRTAPSLSVGATFSALATINSSYFSSMRKYGVKSSAVAGQMMGLNGGTEYQVNIGLGFYQSISFGIDDEADVADARMSVGIISSPTVANVNPSTLTNCIILGNDSTEANLQIMHNDGSGICTKIDLGANFPANTRNTDWYQFELFCKGNEDVVYYRVTRKNTGHITTGVITTDLPSQTQLIGFHFKRGNGTDALAVRLAFGQFIRSYSN